MMSPPDLCGKLLYAISDQTDALLPGMKVVLISVRKPDGADVLVSLTGLLKSGCSGETSLI